uniref:Mitochondrial import inner membrane translocase subunit TIM14-1 n=1 Tax=Tanacetum cinerariifolium TaxID=118510 RepID=A0A6L2LYD9_TANCI|nr:mitochondrial import inner membrane translocase subunit TIM14-1 [Tanacetum cinerariifolium]
MMTYLKHTCRFTHAQLKSRSFKEIQKLYTKEQKWVDAFVPIGSVKDEKRVGSRKKRAVGSSSKQKSPKKQKVNDQESVNSDKELRKCLNVVPNDAKAINYETLDVKSLIVDCESRVLGTIEAGDVHVYKLTRLDGSYRHFSTFSRMLEVLDRQDMLDLHKIVMERFPANDTEGVVQCRWIGREAIRRREFIWFLSDFSFGKKEVSEQVQTKQQRIKSIPDALDMCYVKKRSLNESPASVYSKGSQSNVSDEHMGPSNATAQVVAAAMAGKYGIQAWHSFNTRPPRPTSHRFYKRGFQPTMTKREAALILGVREDTVEEKVREAHRRVMVANHLDAGGNHYLASKINEAKDMEEGEILEDDADDPKVDGGVKRFECGGNSPLPGKKNFYLHFRGVQSFFCLDEAAFYSLKHFVTDMQAPPPPSIIIPSNNSPHITPIDRTRITVFENQIMDPEFFLERNNGTLGDIVRQSRVLFSSNGNNELKDNQHEGRIVHDHDTIAIMHNTFNNVNVETNFSPVGVNKTPMESTSSLQSTDIHLQQKEDIENQLQISPSSSSSQNKTNHDSASITPLLSIKAAKNYNDKFRATPSSNSHQARRTTISFSSSSSLDENSDFSLIDPMKYPLMYASLYHPSKMLLG